MFLMWAEPRTEVRMRRLRGQRTVRLTTLLALPVRATLPQLTQALVGMGAEREEGRLILPRLPIRPLPLWEMHHAMVEMMTTFLQAQAEAMAAHAHATAAQQLPALPFYTGEGKQAADDGFERWIERFKERAKVAG